MYYDHDVTDATQTTVSDRAHMRRIDRLMWAADATLAAGRPYQVRMHGYVSERAATDAAKRGERPTPATVTVTVRSVKRPATDRVTVSGYVTDDDGSVAFKAYNVCRAARVVSVRGPVPAAHAVLMGREPVTVDIVDSDGVVTPTRYRRDDTSGGDFVFWRATVGDDAVLTGPDRTAPGTYRGQATTTGPDGHPAAYHTATGHSTERAAVRAALMMRAAYR